MTMRSTLDHRASRSTKENAELGTAAVAAGLERVRAGLHECLDQLEQRINLSDVVASEKLRDLETGWRELEEEREKLHSEEERHAQEWQSRLADLESDRKLLAEAWERLEKEQLSGGAGQASGPQPPRANPSGSVMSPTTVGSGGVEETVSRSVLRQFETLRHDVRLRATPHPPGRKR